MITEVLFFIIIIGLLVFLFCREKQHEKTLRDILAAKLSRDASEFEFITKTKKEKPLEKKTDDGIPLEDVSAEKMLESFSK